MKKQKKSSTSVVKWKASLYDIIFEADTMAGKVFDLLLILLITASVFSVVLESMYSAQGQVLLIFRVLEWSFSLLFLTEYVLRLICVRRPKSYALSFFGIIDLLAAMPVFLIFFFGSLAPLLTLRSLRLLRIFRVLKLSGLLEQGELIIKSIKASTQKIAVFLFTVFIITIIFGTLVYTVEEGSGSGFDTIPRSIYWCIVTMTTVGYGDISPQTALGQFIASTLMLLGYAIIAIPTGIVTSEMIQSNSKKAVNTLTCPCCNKHSHAPDAVFCRFCGEKLNNV